VVKREGFPDELYLQKGYAILREKTILETGRIWILRTFADSGKEHFRWKRAYVPGKPNGFFDLL
jgi:hypothetical protein